MIHDQITKYRYNIKKTYVVMKEIIGKRKLTENFLPKHIFHDKVNIFDQKTTAEHLNKFFIEVGPQRVEQIISSI